MTQKLFHTSKILNFCTLNPYIADEKKSDEHTISLLNSSFKEMSIAKLGQDLQKTTYPAIVKWKGS